MFLRAFSGILYAIIFLPCFDATGGHSIRVLNVRSFSDDGNLCPVWLVILNHFEIVSERAITQGLKIISCKTATLINFLNS